MPNKASPGVLALPASTRRARASELVEDVREVFRQQAAAISCLADRVDTSYAHAIDTLGDTTGHIVIFGVGKSGLIGQKIASTLASTGAASFFVHATEAYHGDLGMVTQRDTAILISCSGETEEVVRLMPHLRRLGIPTIGLVGSTDSSLARSVDVALDVSVDREACPNNLAPTNSTLATLAMGDAIAVSLMRRRDFRASDFARFHPGGSLGRQLVTQVGDAMRSANLPTVSPTDTVAESLIAITAGRLGLVLVMTGERLVGLITDGDLRRAMQRYPNLLTMQVSEIMTQNPVTIEKNTLLGDAHRRMQQMKLKALVVVDEHGKVAGVVEVFDDETND